MSNAPKPSERPQTALARLVESRQFNVFITSVIVVNAISLGLETSADMRAVAGTWLNLVDRIAIGIFCAELLLRIWVYRWRFFTGGWNIFDFVIVTVSLLPAASGYSVLRSLRILRVLRLISVVPQMRTVVGALFQSLPGMVSIVAVLILVFYVAAVMSTTLFGADFPEFFGSVGGSMYSLFQIMTLESWSMGIVRPVMEKFPAAWAFFVPFVIVTSFAVLNLFIALIVNSMQAAHEADRTAAAEIAEVAHDERVQLQNSISKLSDEVRELKALLAERSPGLAHHGEGGETGYSART